MTSDNESKCSSINKLFEEASKLDKLCEKKIREILDKETVLDEAEYLVTYANERLAGICEELEAVVQERTKVLEEINSILDQQSERIKKLDQPEQKSLHAWMTSKLENIAQQIIMSGQSSTNMNEKTEEIKTNLEKQFEWQVKILQLTCRKERLAFKVDINTKKAEIAAEYEEIEIPIRLCQSKTATSIDTQSRIVQAQAILKESKEKYDSYLVDILVAKKSHQELQDKMIFYIDKEVVEADEQNKLFEDLINQLESEFKKVNEKKLLHMKYEDDLKTANSAKNNATDKLKIAKQDIEDISNKIYLIRERDNFFKVDIDKLQVKIKKEVEEAVQKSLKQNQFWYTILNMVYNFLVNLINSIFFQTSPELPKSAVVSAADETNIMPLAYKPSVENDLVCLMIFAGVLPLAYRFKLKLMSALAYRICGGMIISGCIHLSM